MPRRASVPVRLRTIRIHGQAICYRDAGSGPVVLLIHGIAEAGWVWDTVIPHLARTHRVIAMDLLGHGRSAKPRGDYSLGSHATLLRDLLVALQIRRATLVGHSLGGGIAMQFAHQYPERCERMVLLASGGLGQDVTFVLRSLGLPGANLVAPLVLSNGVRKVMLRTGGWLAARGLRASPAQAALWRSFEGLSHPATRDAFISTVQSVIDHRGQRVSALDRLYLARELPTMLLWGERDHIIPVAHARAAHQQMPHSRLEVVAKAGHFLPLEQPELVATLLLDFLRSTRPAHLTADKMLAEMRTVTATRR